MPRGTVHDPSRRYLPYWALVLVTGVVEAAVALYLLTRPDITLIAAVLAIGFASMLYGALEIVAAFEGKKLPQRFDEVTATATAATADKQLDPFGLMHAIRTTRGHGPAAWNSAAETGVHQLVSEGGLEPPRPIKGTSTSS